MNRQQHSEFLHKSTLSRRKFLEGTTALGASTVLATSLAGTSSWAETPNKGGTLKLAMAGGSNADSMDTATTNDIVGIFNDFTTFNCLAELTPDREVIPELAESWEARPGAQEWVLNIRKDVEFHNGKTVDVEDVLFSINRHRGEDSHSGATGAVSGISDVKILDKNQVLVTLHSPNADLPYVFTDYHIAIVPKDFSDWANPVGSGPYKMVNYIPGVGMYSERNPNYWKEGRAHVDAVEVVVANDASARTSAIQAKEVHAINQVEPRTAGLLQESARLQTASSGKFFALCMLMDHEPYTDANVRNALKYGLDREAVVKNVLGGHASLGNDHPVPPSDPFFNSELPQHSFDPDKARWHLEQAGLSSLTVDLSVAEAGFAGAVDTGAIFQENAKAAGIDIVLNRESSDGYWSNIWMVKPFCASWWSGRPTADLMLSVALKSDAPWNETHFRNETFDKMLVEARGLLDTEKRRELYWEMQRMISEEGGYIIPVFPSVIDAYSEEVQGVVEDHNWGLMGMRLAERAWLA